MKNQNNKNKIIGGGEPNLLCKFGAKEFYFYYFGFFIAVYFLFVSCFMFYVSSVSAQSNFPKSDVDITWITNSQSPDLYRAKLMPTQNSSVTISAMPFVYRPGTKNLIASSNLIYNWIIDGKMNQEKSGLNKFLYAFPVTNFPRNPYSIRLEIKTVDGSFILNKYVTIPVVRPEVLLYFSDQKTGMPFGAALKNLTTKQTSLNFVAQTYSFSTLKKNLKWQWFINNVKVIGENEKPWLATLNLANNFSGRLSAQIKVVAQNPNNELEISQSTTNLEIQ